MPPISKILAVQMNDILPCDAVQMTYIFILRRTQKNEKR